mmetsp:Transcript_38309/g.73686  ORF Transcript_38309/g.73686 Transcript_38309/m.73686 type:complete len:93 (+) Transcript_38309:196-474(+)
MHLRKSDEELELDDGTGVVRVASSKLTKDHFRRIKKGDYVNVTGAWRGRISKFQSHSIKALSNPNAEALWLCEILDCHFYHKLGCHPLLKEQ